MRIVTKWKVDYLPIDFRMKIVSLIKECLRRTDEAYFKKSYEKHKMKNFCFSPYLKNAKFFDHHIELEELHITFSTNDFTFLMKLYNGLLQVIKDSTYGEGNTVLREGKVELLPVPQIIMNKATFYTKSPMMIYNKNKDILLPQDQDFIPSVKYIANVILKNSRGYGLLEPLSVKLDEGKKVVIKETFSENRETLPTYLKFQAWQGFIELKGHIQDLNDLFLLGLSFRRNQGYGLLSLIK